MEDALTDPDLEEDGPADPWWKRLLTVWILPLAGFVVLWFVLGWLRAPSLPEQAPAFRLPSVDGQTVALSDYRGRTVVLNFWATWCGPCRIEGPSFASFAQDHPEITVLGLASDTDAAKVRKAGKDMGLTYPLVMADAATLHAYGVNTFPTTVIIGPEGEVRHAHTGMLFGPQLWALTQL